GGVLENFKFWGIKADVVKSDSVVVPAFKGNRIFEFAKPATEKTEKDAAENKDTSKAKENDSGKTNAAKQGSAAANSNTASTASQQKNTGGAQ
ncbi:MAG: hypothetical protein IJV12_01040, partial [Acidaminococcaceae bacterium]|nr:hypothetical protein [Acidaminococcaceae bacterium]